MKGKSSSSEAVQPAVESGVSENSRDSVERTPIREQLDSILASTPFRNSKRYPAMLRYLVERTLDGATSDLKERTLGVEVFGREPDYDQASDPVVRISAGEIRKRLAQYYQKPEHAGELRIELPVGSYVPEFSESEPGAGAASAPAPARKPFGWLRPTLLLVVVTLFVVVALRWPRSSNALDGFWRPVVAPGQVMVCVGAAGVPARESNIPGVRPGTISWADALTLSQIGVFLKSNGATPEFYREDRATFTDLQQQPAVLIGGLNDEWALRLMQNLRFQFRQEGNSIYILDREHPDSRAWSITVSKFDADGQLSLDRDYAVISRLANPRTGRMTVTLAGLWGYGTIAASQFVTEPEYLQAFAKTAPSGWEHKNLQFVISTEVIDGNSGPPHVLAATYW